MLSVNQIRAQVGWIRKRWSDSPVIGLRSAARWNGEDQVEVDGAPFRLRSAETELEMRAVLSEPRPETTGLVVLTNLDASAIGEDLLARFARRRFHVLSAGEILRELFNARTVDPRLESARWMARALADARPEGGYPSLAQGSLDQETAWGFYLSQILSLRQAKPDLVSLLEWSRVASHVTAWRGLDEEARIAVQRWIESSAGSVASWVWAALSIEGNPSVVSLAMVSVVLFQRTEVPMAIATARGKFERYFGDRHLSVEEGRMFARSANGWLDSNEGTVDVVRSEIQKSDDIVRELRIEAHAIDSDVSLLGFEQRLAAFGRAAAACLARPGQELARAVAVARDAVVQHRSAKRETERVERVEMALRLVRWWLSRGTGGDGAGLVALARAYVDQGSFVDYARYLLLHGDGNPELNQAFANLLDIVGGERERTNKIFGQALVDWCQAPTNAPELLLIENILHERVAAVAKHMPVLVLVLDGMSYPIQRQLMAALCSSGWSEAIPESMQTSVPAVAGLPTITEWSRRLLLGGKPNVSAGEDEVALFRDAPSLSSVVRSSHPPILFRKGELSVPSERSLSPSVRQEIASTQRQVVGVIINAIDDYLAKDDQLHIDWTPGRVPLLEQILEVARDARRAVILTSDHGHVISHHARLLRARAGTPDRHRSADGAMAPDELLLGKGRAAMHCAGGFVAPWSERVYYTTRRNGHHGGVTPQEVLVPATVLVADGRAPQGWRLVPQDLPAWWWDTNRAPLVIAEMEPKTSGKKQKKQAAGLETLPLFETGPVPSDGWIVQLLSCPTFVDQYAKAGRAPPSREIIQKVLKVLGERNGTQLRPVLAQRISEPEFRIAGLLAGMRRILNVEGYPVLTVDDGSGTVRFDRELLNKQFDLHA